MNEMKKSFVPVIILVLALTGCARTEKVRAVESPAALPYESLGTIQVKARASRISLGSIAGTTAEAVTLTAADTPSRAERYKSVLQKKLARTAKDRYDAHAVINVQYWPDPALEVFPDGFIHAQGEMIRYQKFPPASAGETASPAAPQ